MQVLYRATVTQREVTLDKTSFHQNAVGKDVLALTLDSEWDGAEYVVVTFYRGRASRATSEICGQVLWSGDDVLIPAGALTEAGELRLTVTGIWPDGSSIVTCEMEEGGEVCWSGTDAVDWQVDPGSDAVRVLVEMVKASALAAESAKESAATAVADIDGLNDRLNLIANSDDETLDQLAEFAEFVKENRELIENLDPLPSGGSDGQVLTLVDGEAAWSDQQDADWDASEGEPGYIANKPIDVENAVLMDSTVSGGGAIIYDGIDIVAGQTYRVDLDGVTYSGLVANESNEIGSDRDSINNPGEYPFYIMGFGGSVGLMFASSIQNASFKLIHNSVSLKKVLLPYLVGEKTSDGGEVFNGPSNKATAVSSHAEGDMVTASGVGAHAEGGVTTASGRHSHAEGDNSKSEGEASHAEGNHTTASKRGAHSEGGYTQATNECAHAEGTSCIASGMYSHAEGQSSQASGQNAHAEGYSTISSGSCSHSEGYDTEANKQGAHAEGSSTLASGSYSHAEGYSTISSATSSHAEGHDTEATGQGAHSEGTSTKANANGAHAEGYGTTASNIASHSEGYYTLASSNYQHVQGKYNVSDSANAFAHIVGNGKSASTRSNAHTLDWDGNAWYAGTVLVGGTSQADASEVATKAYVDEVLGVIENGSY